MGTALHILIAPNLIKIFSGYLLAPLGAKIAANYMVANIQWADRKVYPGDDLGKVWAGLGVGLLMATLLTAPLAALVGVIAAGLGVGALFATDSGDNPQAVGMVFAILYAGLLMVAIPFTVIFSPPFAPACATAYGTARGCWRWRSCAAACRRGGPPGSRGSNLIVTVLTLGWAALGQGADVALLGFRPDGGSAWATSRRASPPFGRRRTLGDVGLRRFWRPVKASCSRRGAC